MILTPQSRWDRARRNWLSLFNFFIAICGPVKYIIFRLLVLNSIFRCHLGRQWSNWVGTQVDIWMTFCPEFLIYFQSPTAGYSLGPNPFCFEPFLFVSVVVVLWWVVSWRWCNHVLNRETRKTVQVLFLMVSQKVPFFPWSNLYGQWSFCLTIQLSSQ